MTPTQEQKLMDALETALDAKRNVAARRTTYEAANIALNQALTAHSKAMDELNKLLDVTAGGQFTPAPSPRVSAEALQNLAQEIRTRDAAAQPPSSERRSRKAY